MPSPRPLVYFTAFAKPDIFVMARLALEALATVSGVHAHCVLVTRGEDASILERAFEGATQNFDEVVLVAARSLSDYTFARYRVLAGKDAQRWEHYSPILYLDTDVVCDRDVTALVAAARLGTKVQLLEDHWPVGQTDWFGRNLFIAEGVAMPADRGWNSGILLSPTWRELHELASRVLALADRLQRTAPELLAVHDQPLVNFVGRKFDLVDPKVMASHARLVGVVDVPDPANALGFAHFAGGVGNVVPKLRLMRRYLDLLRPRLTVVRSAET